MIAADDLRRKRAASRHAFRVGFQRWSLPRLAAERSVLRRDRSSVGAELIARRKCDSTQLRDVLVRILGSEHPVNFFVVGRQDDVLRDAANAIARRHLWMFMSIDLDGYEVLLHRIDDARLVVDRLFELPAWNAGGRPEMEQDRAVFRLCPSHCGIQIGFPIHRLSTRRNACQTNTERNNSNNVCLHLSTHCKYLPVSVPIVSSENAPPSFIGRVATNSLKKIRTGARLTEKAT